MHISKSNRLLCGWMSPYKRSWEVRLQLSWTSASNKRAIERHARALFRGHTTSPRNMTRLCLLLPSSILLSLAEIRDYSLSAERLEWGLNGTTTLGGKHGTLVCNFAVLRLRSAHNRFRSIYMQWMLLTLDSNAALLIADCISNFSLPLYLFLFHKQPSQVGSLFTFLARQMAKQDNRLQVNKILFEQVSVCEIRRNAIAMNHAKVKLENMKSLQN